MAESYWTPIFDWLREDAEIADWLNEAQRAVLEDAQDEVLPIWHAMLLYQGFDIKRIVRNMIQRRAHYLTLGPSVNYDVHVTVAGNPEVFRYATHSTLAADIELIIFLFAERGNAVQRVIEKSLPELTPIVECLITKYDLDITIHAPNTALAADVVSISRVVSCFPAKICEYYHRGYGNKLMTFADMQINAPAGLSQAVLCPHLTALLPKESVTLNPEIHFVFFLCHVLVDNVIHQKARNFTDLSQMFTYYAAEYRSDGTPQAARLRFCRIIHVVRPGLIDFAVALMNAIAGAQARIRALRPNDPNLDRVIEDLRHLI